MAFNFYKNTGGAPTEMASAVSFGAITKGDAIRFQVAADTNTSTDYTTVLTVDTHDAVVAGVACNTVAAAGSTVNYIIATPQVLFSVETGATTGWDEDTMVSGTACDYATDGQTVAAAASTTADAFVVLGLMDGSTSGTAGNKVYGYFVNTTYNKTS
jgi:hypothetical protein